VRYLHQIAAENFLSLRDVTVDLADLSVLVGPNGSGKSNFLRVIPFLGDTARLDLGPAIAQHGGFAALRFRAERSGPIRLSLKARVTRYASDAATDDYTLEFRYRH
jgi:predicted ATPase